MVSYSGIVSTQENAMRRSFQSVSFAVRPRIRPADLGGLMPAWLFGLALWVAAGGALYVLI
jgi:hypothetical protein